MGREDGRISHHFIGDRGEESEHEEGEKRAGNEADCGHAQPEEAVELGGGDGDPDAGEADDAGDGASDPNLVWRA